MLRIGNAALGVSVLSEAGGGIAGFDWHGRRGDSIPLMRPYSPAPRRSGQQVDPRQLSCFPLVPWSNRIADGGFTVGGRWIALPRNCEDEPWPIHGSGWQFPWQVEVHEACELRLSLRQRAANAYCYDAALKYAVHDDTLRVDLAVTNVGSTTMPFGLGLHPFFARRGGVRLLAPASEVWLNDGQTPLPTERVAVPAEWDFRTEHTLPESGLDHAFQAWTGEAMIHWPSDRLGLRISTNVDAFVLYTPANHGFFCFEPVDHPINAVHLPGGASNNGMTMLSPQAVLRRRFSFSVVDMP